MGSAAVASNRRSTLMSRFSLRTMHPLLLLIGCIGILIACVVGAASIGSAATKSVAATPAWPPGGLTAPEIRATLDAMPTAAAAVVAAQPPTAMPKPQLPTAPPVPSDCAGANEAVRNYKAPGQREPLLSVIAMRLVLDSRPHKVEGWETPYRVEKVCFTTLRVNIGNERQRFSWRYDLSTGTVEARDDQTKRISGW